MLLFLADDVILITTISRPVFVCVCVCVCNILPFYHFCFFLQFHNLLVSSYYGIPDYTMNTSLVLYRKGTVTDLWFVTSNYLSSSITLTQCVWLVLRNCISALGPIARLVSGVWCNLQNTWASVVFGTDSEWAARVSVLTLPIYSHSQRGVC